MGHTASAQHLRWTVPSVGDEGVSATLPHPHVAAEKRSDGDGENMRTTSSSCWPLHPADGATTGGGAGVINCGHGYISNIHLPLSQLSVSSCIIILFM